MSVLVASRNRARSLERFLSRLAAQEDPPSFQVVVADSGSTDRTPEVVRSFEGRLPLVGVRLEEAGKGRALNAGLRAATGSLIVFADDDVQPDARWLAELHAAASAHPEFGVFGGRIDVDLDRVPGWVRRSRNLMGLLTSQHSPPGRVYGFGRYPYGPNMAVRRVLLDGVEAPYPEEMGPGTDLPVGDESAFFVRVSPPHARDRLHVPTARVLHEVESHNVSLPEALRRSFWQGRAQARLRIPAVPSGAPGRSTFLRAALARLRACGSLREVLCVCLRHLGYLRGSREPPLAPRRGVEALPVMQLEGAVVPQVEEGVERVEAPSRGGPAE